MSRENSLEKGLHLLKQFNEKKLDPKPKPTIITTSLKVLDRSEELYD